MVTFTINGSNRTFDGDPDMPLLWYLRDELGLTGTSTAAAAASAAPAPCTWTGRPSARARRR